MKKKNTSLLAEASAKSSKQNVLPEAQLPLLEVILNTRAEIEALSAQVGLKIIDHFVQEEIQQRCGPWGQQSAYRHGQQPGYVVFAGRKGVDPALALARSGARTAPGELLTLPTGRPDAAGGGPETDPSGLDPK